MNANPAAGLRGVYDIAALLKARFGSGRAKIG